VVSTLGGIELRRFWGRPCEPVADAVIEAFLGPHIVALSPELSRG
jgi:hypothetical protein